MLKLLSIGAKEIIIRDAGICEVCESKCGDKAAADTVLKIQELLKDSGLQQKVSVITNVVSINNLTFKGDRLKDYKEDYEVSRREIFSMFRKGTYKGIAEVIKEESPQAIESGRDRLKKGLPKEREELLKAMEGLISSNVNPQTPFRSRIFPAVKIDKGCDICKLCHLFCPTDALTIEDTKEGQGIAFKAATCLGCGLCAPVCAKNVLTLKAQEILPDEIIQQKKRIIVWFDKAQCADCGRNFVKIKSGEICDTCLKERELQ
jgi:Pyruvate/2-oxoacid:ferredoxin oxidoreductase delta subunit